MSTPRAFYNEIDPGAAKVLRRLIHDGVIAPGDVDTRSITEIRPEELNGYTQAHFFAGGGLWSVAARIAGWPDARPLWSASCPCQPHSTAAADKRKKFADERDLWPHFYNLVRERCPDSVVGEQVDDNAAWIDRAIADMEAANYAIGTLDLPSCAVGAPIERMRTFIVAKSNGAGCREQGGPVAMAPQQFPAERAGRGSLFSDHSTTGELGRTRRHEPGIRLLSDDVPGRVALLRIAGNAINPVLAAQVLSAFMAVNHG